VHRALEAAEKLRNERISCRVVNMSTLKPIDEALIIDSAIKTDCIVTAEDHNIIGGLGSAVAEVLVRNRPCYVTMVGIKDKFGESGDPNDLAKKYELDSAGIIKAVYRALERKG